MSPIAPILLTLACAACTAALVRLPAQAGVAARAVAKLGASSAFVGVALAVGALQWRHGQWMLAALVLGWIGDACLLSRRGGAFLAGLGAFLLSHAVYATAFVAAGVAAGAVPVALAVAVAIGAVLLRWLMPHVPTGFRMPVIAYVVVILAMGVAAVAHALASGRGGVLAGALLFAASDVAVARERFVASSAVNRRWGLPAYYAAQLLLAWSAAAPAPG
ncbi:MAG: lysoplasmalogenase [Rubrivivax sp.]|nr:lysoplasmalogenase [Rubrivivax sp.]